jgi:pyruvate dehydrogenase E1 component alpha subunit
MLRIRHFELAIERLFAEGRIGGTAHPAIGQEAVAVGMGAAIERGDFVTSTHRGHGHFLALGADPGRMMAEFFGRADGYGGGRAGSQMMADPDIGFLGANGITAGSLPLAAGVALAFRLQSKPNAIIAIFGDGASSQGVFHETLNLATLWRLPLVLLCEHNGYGMSTPTARAVAGGTLLPRAAAYGIPALAADGNDVVAVHAAVRRALAHARKVGPVLLELATYRLSGHSKGDPRVYRTRDEETEAWRRDPIPRLEEALSLSVTERDAARAAAESEILGAIAFAEASPLPDPVTASFGVTA